MACHGKARTGLAWRAKDSHGKARLGEARHGVEGQAMARPGEASQGSDGQAPDRLATARLGGPSIGSARQGTHWRGVAWDFSVWFGAVRQAKACLGAPRRGWAGLGDGWAVRGEACSGSPWPWHAVARHG